MLGVAELGCFVVPGSAQRWNFGYKDAARLWTNDLAGVDRHFIFDNRSGYRVRSLVELL